MAETKFKSSLTGQEIENVLTGIRGVIGIPVRRGENVYEAATASDITAVSYGDQELTADEKAKARANLGVSTGEFRILGHFDQIVELPKKPKTGDAYMIGAMREVYIYDGAEWFNVGPIGGFKVLGHYDTADELPTDALIGDAYSVGENNRIYIFDSAKWFDNGVIGGITLDETSVTYQASSSGTTPPTGEWLSSPPEVAEGQYLWTKSYVLYSTGASYTAYSVGYHGEKGDVGPQGEKGDTGDAAGFGTVTATIDANVGTPSVEVTVSGPNTAKNFDFKFKNMKGETGATPTIDAITDAQIDALFA